MKLQDITRRKGVAWIIDRALEEDIGAGDVTTNALVPRKARAEAVILSRRNCIVSGNDVAKAVFKRLDRRLTYAVKIRDGQHARAGQTVAVLRGPARAILTAERTALNFMQRMSGIATLTGKFAQKVRRRGVVILDTRKTAPGLRALDKYAVLCGGGRNHRMGLYDRFLIKDNHRCFWRSGRTSRLDQAIMKAAKAFPGLQVEAEVENESEMKAALAAGADWILLDNMTPARLRRFVKICRGRSRLEASGGITLKNVGKVAATGVDAISLGCLTHSAPAADLSLEIL